MSNFFHRIANKALTRNLSREEGQGVVEYALVLGVLVVAIFLAFITTDIETAIGNAITALTDQMP